MRILALSLCFVACAHRDEIAPAPRVEVTAPVDAAPPPPLAPPSAAPSPKAPIDPSVCLADCGKHSQKCDLGCAGDKGCLRKCGCARVSCKQDCEKGGPADFRCH